MFSQLPQFTFFLLALCPLLSQALRGFRSLVGKLQFLAMLGLKLVFLLLLSLRFVVQQRLVVVVDVVDADVAGLLSEFQHFP